MAFGFPKPFRGSALLERRKTRAERVAAEQTVMQAAKKRDGGKCRVPNCEFAKRDMPIDAAHLRHRGAGGNPSGDRTTRDTVISVCRIHHSMFDRAAMDITPTTPKCTDGPCDFSVPDQQGRMAVVASERLIGVSATRDGR